MAVTNPDRLAAVAPERGTRPKEVVIDAMMVWLAFNLDLQRGVDAGFVRKIAMIDAILRATHVDEKFVIATCDSGVGQATVPPSKFDSGSIRLPFAEG